jgi:hypothetical protein
MNHQRKNKTKLERGAPRPRTMVARAVRLGALGFAGRVPTRRRRHLAWEVRLVRLAAYKKTYGDCNVPRR